MTLHLRNNISLQETLNHELALLLANLGKGRTDGVAYDTAWVARLSEKYSDDAFTTALDWIRQHQHVDGTWGAPTKHHHDHYISTLAAITTLQKVGREKRDKRRIKRGEKILWRLVGKLAADDHDTIGFPILAIKLSEEALKLGLNVPQPPVRHVEAFSKRVEKMLVQSNRNWRRNSLSFSLEVLRHELHDDDVILDDNGSVAVSPAATAGYLLENENDTTMTYLLNSLADEGTGAARAVDPINSFETSWVINHLRYANLITPDHPDVKHQLAKLWGMFSKREGLGYSSHSLLNNVDDTAAGWAALKWAGYTVNAEVFAPYEAEKHFQGIIGETDPAVSAHVRLLVALRMLDNDDPRKRQWIPKILDALIWLDRNNSFWTDKWHSSPYYVNATAVWALYGLNNDLAYTRLNWILQTQNDDGGWGYFDNSTPEETAYCMEALLWWDRHVERLDDTLLSEAANYLIPHMTDEYYTPLWIGKSLYSPHYVVKAAILGAVYRYTNRELKNG